jgi:ferredoxin
MPKVTLVRESRTIEVEDGANLREALLAADLVPYRGAWKLMNCRGHGRCKSCRVRIEPEGNVSPRTAAELPRASGSILQIIDHRELIGWRLSCQAKVRGDIVVTTQT